MPGPSACMRSRVQGRDPVVVGEGAAARRHTRETGRNGPFWGVSQGGGDALDGRLSRAAVDIMEIQHVEIFEKT